MEDYHLETSALLTSRNGGKKCSTLPTLLICGHGVDKQVGVEEAVIPSLR